MPEIKFFRSTNTFENWCHGIDTLLPDIWVRVLGIWLFTFDSLFREPWQRWFCLMRWSVWRGFRWRSFQACIAHCLWQMSVATIYGLSGRCLFHRFWSTGAARWEYFVLSSSVDGLFRGMRGVRWSLLISHWTCCCIWPIVSIWGLSTTYRTSLTNFQNKFNKTVASVCEEVVLFVLSMGRPFAAVRGSCLYTDIRW